MESKRNEERAVSFECEDVPTITDILIGLANSPGPRSGLRGKARRVLEAAVSGYAGRSESAALARALPPAA